MHDAPGRRATPRAAARAMIVAGGAIALGLVALAWPAPPARAGSFVVQCPLSHRSTDDPIVLAGEPGMSHWHDFYGSSAARADATYASMLAGTSRCSERLDTAGYWHPRLEAGGRPQRAVLRAYYSRGGKPTVQPFPRDLKMVAGDPHSLGMQPTSRVWWRCDDGSSGDAPRARAREQMPPACPAGTRLAAAVAFPDCWNGWQLDDPADHRSHMAYSRHGACPRGFPVPLPRLVLQASWPVRPQSPSLVTLGGGMVHGFHADFWNTWHQPRLRQLTNQCLNQDVACGLVAAPRPRR